MPLKLKLSAHERLVVNGAVIVNGGGRTSLIIRNYAHIMREKDVLQEEDANTPTRRLYFLVQAMLMRPPPAPELLDSFATAMSQLAAAYVKPQNLEVLRDVARLVDVGDFYKALMRLHPLIDYEAELLQVPTHEWRRSKLPPVSLAAAPR